MAYNTRANIWRMQLLQLYYTHKPGPDKSLPPLAWRYAYSTQGECMCFTLQSAWPVYMHLWVLLGALCFNHCHWQRIPVQEKYFRCLKHTCYLIITEYFSFFSVFSNWLLNALLVAHNFLKAFKNHHLQRVLLLVWVNTNPTDFIWWF